MLRGLNRVAYNIGSGCVCARLCTQCQFEDGNFSRTGSATILPPCCCQLFVFFMCRRLQQSRAGVCDGLHPSIIAKKVVLRDGECLTQFRFNKVAM